MPPQLIAIYGAGGFGREVAWLVSACATSGRDVQVGCFVDDAPEQQGRHIHDLPVFSLADAARRFPEAYVLAAVGSPRTRQSLVARAEQAGFRQLTLVHPRVEHSSFIAMGLGTMICAGAILTTDIVLGQQVQINLGCTVGHDVQLGNYTTLAPGAHVSGYVTTGNRVYIGTGAVIVNGTAGKPIVIEDDVVIGAGACVTKSVTAGLTVVGVPARPLIRDYKAA